MKQDKGTMKPAYCDDCDWKGRIEECDVVNKEYRCPNCGSRNIRWVYRIPKPRKK